MNATRRKEIDRAIGLIQEAQGIVEACFNEEQEAFDSMSEKSQESEKGQAIEYSASELEEAVGGCESAIANLENAKGQS